MTNIIKTIVRAQFDLLVTISFLNKDISHHYQFFMIKEIRFNRNLVFTSFLNCIFKSSI